MYSTYVNPVSVKSACAISQLIFLLDVCNGVVRSQDLPIILTTQSESTKLMWSLDTVYIHHLTYDADLTSHVWCFQLAFGSREHPLAAAPVCHAEGCHSSVFSSGEGRPSCSRALFRRVGPHTPDCSSGQDLVGSLLQDIGGESLHSLAISRILNLLL